MGRSGKLRSGTASKLKRWRKGHSSDSNPEGRRYRLAARGRLLAPRSENSNLTVDALKLHNDLQSLGPVPREGAKAFMEEDEKSETKTHKSSATFLSGLSDCTNQTFSRVHRLWESNSAAHKEICAVLAAVTEVIRIQGGTESETEYFGALKHPLAMGWFNVTLKKYFAMMKEAFAFQLDVFLSDQLMTTLETVESPESLAAVAYLLNLVLKRVPGPVLIKKFSDISKVFMGILSSQTCGESTSALRWLLSCLATLLRRQNLGTWNYPVTMQVFHGLLSFTVHAKPKVRKAAQHGVCSILRGSEFLFGDGAPLHHPAALSTAKFCVQEIEKSGGAKEATTTLHMLTLLRDLLPCLPAPAVKSCCETLLRVMTLSHVLVSACAMKAFHSLFVAQPPPACLPAELNAQIIMALYDFVPHESDLQPLLAWLSVMEQAHVNLARLQWDLCWAHLPRLFSAAMNCCLSPHAQIVSAAAQILMVLLKECVAPYMTELGFVSSAKPSGSAVHLCKMFRAVEQGLTYQYHAAWASVLQVLKVFFESCGQQCHPLMQKCLQSLADLRGSSHFPHQVLLDQTMGAAVATMGPEVVLGAVPLDIDGSEETMEFPRSWLLPVLRDHIQNAPLAFFSSHFLPLATSLKDRAIEFAQAGQDLEAKIYDTLQWQIWTVLPGFCSNPTDVLLSFKGLARTLGMAISDRPDLRQIVCQALRRLINKGCQTEAERAELGRFAKNFLPILFNVYSQEGDSESSVHRRSLLDTIRTYLTVTEAQMVSSFLEKACGKLTSPDSSEFTRLSILDLIVTMAPHADESSLNALYGTIKSSLQNRDHRIQKKVYRVLEEVCASDQPACQNFVQSHLEELKGALLESLTKATSPAKRPRLKCLFHVIKQLTVEHEDFVTALVPEVILCTKEVSVGARKNAYNLLVEIGHTFLRFGVTPHDGLQRYLLLVYAGLTGSVTMISCTVLALSRLLYEFKEHIGSDTLEPLVKNVCLMVGSRTRDVVKSALGFLKVAVLLLDTALLGRHLETMLEAIGSLTDDMRRHFRMKLRNLLSRLMRKFGFEPLQALLPEPYRKVLLNIRKAETRNRKRQALKQAAASSAAEEKSLTPLKGNSIEDVLADSDSDLEGDTEKHKGRETRKAQRQQNQAWLKEGESDEPLNFLDPNVAHRVLATKPGTGQTRKVSHDFKFSADGRLIISEEEVESKEANEEMGDLMQEVGIRSKKVQKRQFQKEADDEWLDAETQPQYKAGGTGIHRPVNKSEAPGVEYRAKKGSGDIKKKGSLDPYAYIPLNRAKLNRRKKAKLQGQYKGLMKGAQRGAQTGKRLYKKQSHL